MQPVNITATMLAAALQQYSAFRFGFAAPAIKFLK
jgi:hypothetical protein